jgi:hypothetical protein
MSDQQPPRVATWLAQRLVTGLRRESLVGDLIEQYRQGRSRLWYGRQVFAAIVVGAVHDLKVHKLLALRALTIGWALYYLFSFPVTWAGRPVENWISQQVVVCEPNSFWCQFWLNQFSVEPLIYIAAAVSGWIVARLHRSYWVAMLFLYAATVLLFECGMIAWLAGHSIRPLPISPVVMTLANLTVVVRPLSILLGGMLAVRSNLGQAYGRSIP